MPSWMERIAGESVEARIRHYMAPDSAITVAGGEPEQAEAEDDGDAEKTDEPVEEEAAEDTGGEFDIAGWWKSQPDEVRKAISEGDIDKVQEAARKERQERKKAENELRALKREEQLAEEKKAKDEGRWKELAERNEQRAKELEAKLEAEEWTRQTRSLLKDEELVEFEDILLASRETPDDVAETGKNLKAMIDKRVEAEVAKRLETGSRVKSNGNTVPTKKYSEMTEDERSAYADEHGHAALRKLIVQERSS